MVLFCVHEMPWFLCPLLRCGSLCPAAEQGMEYINDKGM